MTTINDIDWDILIQEEQIAVEKMPKRQTT